MNLTAGTSAQDKLVSSAWNTFCVQIQTDSWARRQSRGGGWHHKTCRISERYRKRSRVHFHWPQRLVQPDDDQIWWYLPKVQTNHKGTDRRFTAATWRTDTWQDKHLATWTLSSTEKNTFELSQVSFLSNCKSFWRTRQSHCDDKWN